MGIKRSYYPLQFEERKDSGIEIAEAEDCDRGARQSMVMFPEDAKGGSGNGGYGRRPGQRSTHTARIYVTAAVGARRGARCVVRLGGLCLCEMLVSNEREDQGEAGRTPG